MKRPTALELMAFADGELDETRAAEVEAYLAEHADDQHLVNDLGVIGDQVRAAHPGTSLEIADDVMAAIDRLEAAQRNAASMPPPAAHRSARPTPSQPVRSSRARFGPPAAIAAVLAFAAGLFLWSRASVPEVTSGPVASLTPVAEAAPEVADDRSPGAEVDAVDFGGNVGTIFYVPGPSDTSTTVVWIAEDQQ